MRDRNDPPSARDALRKRVINDLCYHPPTDPEAIVKMSALRSHALDFAEAMVDLCPPGRELSSALTKIEEALFHAIASIARS